MRRYSACLEILFTEEPVFANRVALAKAAGFHAIEFWHWTNKDIPALRAALDAAKMPVTAILTEPIINLTDPANHAEFLTGLRDSIATAKMLGATVLITQTGNDLPGRSRAEQRTALVAVLKLAAEILSGTGIRLGVEPLNTPIDHPGYYLSGTSEGFDILDEVNRREIGMTWDIYHSAVMGEPADVIVGHGEHIAHVHLADHPGRHEPGTGQIDFAIRLAALRAEGYDGYIGCEFWPKAGSVAATRAVFEHL